MKILCMSVLLALMLACAQNRNTPAAGENQAKEQLAWPQRNEKVFILESQYLDLGLRTFALELNQRKDRLGELYLEFLPRLGKIEGRFIVDHNRQSRQFYRKRASQSFREQWQKRFNEELSLIQLGISELLSELQLKEGFEPQDHLEIRFQIENPPTPKVNQHGPGKELAVFSQGELQWLIYPN